MKLRKALSILLIAGMLSCPVLGSDIVVVADKEVTTITQVEVGQALEGHETEMQFIRQHGEPVNVSVVKNHVKLTVEYMLADTYEVKLLISAEKTDGIPFKASDRLQIKNVDLKSKEELERQASFEAIPKDATLVERLKVMAQFNEGLKAFIKDDNTVDLEGLTAYLQVAESFSTATTSASYGMYNTEENTDSKVYFTYEGSYSEEILKEMVMSIEAIVGEEEKKEVIATDLASYLTTHQGDVLMTKPNTIDEHEKEYLEKLKETDEASYLERKEELEKEPQILLAERGLGLHLIEGEDSFVIDNIGFIDGKLHVLMLGEGANRYNLEVYNEADEWVSTEYYTGSSRTLEDGNKKNVEYRTYDIPSVKELRAYNFKISSVEVVEQWQGPWEIHLDMSNTPKARIIKVNRVIPYTAEENVHLSEIQVGKRSIALVIDQIESKLSNQNIVLKIKLKDGTERELDYSRGFRQQKDQLILVYRLRDVVGEDIERIDVENKLDSVS